MRKSLLMLNLIFLITTVFSMKNFSQEVFFDDFTEGNKNNWPIGKESNIVNRIIEKGSFHIASLKNGSYPYTIIPIDLDLKKNFEISTVINHQSVNNQAAGLLFGYLDGNNFQSFVMSKNGFFRYGIKEDGVWSDVKTWTKTDYAYTNDPINNKIAVIRQGSDYIFKINDVTVHQTGIIDFKGKGVGFVVNNEQTASFDYLKLRYLNPNENYLPQKTLIARENFNNNDNNWAINNNYPAKFKIENGQYHLEMLKAKMPYQSSRSLAIDYSRNFEIKVRMIKEGGSKEDKYGLIFGMKGIKNLYFFQISGDKKYSIGKVENKIYSYNVNDKESNKIHLLSTNRCYNELSIVRKGTRIYYYVNSVELYNQTFPTLYGDLFGFTIDGKQTILIDYLEVNYLD